MTWTLAEIATYIAGEVRGDPNFKVDSFATLENAVSSQISFLSNSKYKKYLASSQAGAVIVAESAADAVRHNAIVVAEPYIAYAKAASLLNPQIQLSRGVDNTASVSGDSIIDASAHIGPQVVIESGVEIANNVTIGPGCVIKRGVKIGKNTHLTANITLCDGVKIGERCLFHPGAVIGADGFGIANDHGKWIKVPQIGGVVIGDDVEVGANTTIDRGAIEDTQIGNGVKLDNQIQIGHNVQIGNNTVIAGCVGIAGSTHIGENCVIGGGVGVAGHLTIADGVQLTGMTMVTKSIAKSGVYSSGIPAEPTRQWHKNVVRYRQMGDLANRVKRLEQQDK